MNQMTSITKDQPALTMSSREIAELLEARHDSVRRTIERLSDRGVIVPPPLVDEPDTDKMGRSRLTAVYHIPKRDTYIVVAQLSPEFTARIVDRWQELEAKVAKPVILTGPQLMAKALLEADATMKAQAAQIKDMREDVEAHEILVKADGSLNLTDAAKNLGIRPKDLTRWLSQNGWIYKRRPKAPWVGYQTRCNQGLLTHKTRTWTQDNGVDCITKQVRITAKGLSVLAKAVKVPARSGRLVA